MSAYLIAHIEVTDPQAFKAYGEAVPAVVKDFGGRYLVRGGQPEVREGEWTVQRLVIIEFDSPEAARTFYESPEYQAILPLRLAASRGTVAIVPGV